MKIVHYLPGLPPVSSGGLIKYALDLAEGERLLGHEVSLLVPGKITIIKHSRIKIIKRNWKTLNCYHVINPLPVSGGKGIKDIEWFCNRGDIKVYENFLINLKPDVFHVHSFMGLHSACLEAANSLGITTIYTTHDYYGLCPNAILMNQNMQYCMQKDWKECGMCFASMISRKSIWWHHTEIYKKIKENSFVAWLEHSTKLLPVKIAIKSMIKQSKTFIKRNEENKATNKEKIYHVDYPIDYSQLQQYYKEMFLYINYFHFNSTQSRDVYCQHLGALKGNVINISNHSVSDRRILRNYEKTLQIGFIGFGQYHKGFPLLKEALDAVYSKGLTDFICHIFFNLKESRPYIQNHSPYNESEMDEVFQNIDVLILPSVWKETFGMVVLEALSYGIPVIISDNVGAKDILRRYGCEDMIVAADKTELINAIKKIYRNRNALRIMNNKICSWNMDLSFKTQVESILRFYGTASNK